MTTMLNLVRDTQGKVQGSLADEVNILAAPYVPGSGVLSVRYNARAIVPGTILSVGLNTFYVLEGDPSGQRVVVLAQHDGGPDEAAIEGARVNVRPRFTNWRIFSSLVDTIIAMSSPNAGLFAIKTWTAQVDPTYQTYPIPAEAQPIQRLMRVRWESIGSADKWHDIGAASYQYRPDGEDGPVIRILDTIPGGAKVEFVAAGGFTLPTSLDDDIEDLGLRPEWADIPPLGAAADLMVGNEARRLQPWSQGDPRRADELSVTGSSSVAREMRRSYEDRIADERARMVNRYPYQRPILTGGMY